MLVSNISFIGWMHTLACALALITGAWNIAMPKGTSFHRKVGMVYIVTMLFANLSVLGVYTFDIARFQPFKGGPGIFGLFHWEAVATLAALALAFYAARHQKRAVWAYTHPLAVLFTYYMLIGGLINEMFVRITALRALVRPGASFFRSPAVGLTQFAAMILFLAMVLYFIVKVALYRRRSAAGPAIAVAM